jgi:putative membrane protein
MLCNGFSGFGMSGIGIWGFGMMIFQFILFALVIYLLYHFGKRLLNRTSLFSDSHLEILKERYVRGEIDEDEYLKMKKVLAEGK